MKMSHTLLHHKCSTEGSCSAHETELQNTQEVKTLAATLAYSPTALHSPSSYKLAARFSYAFM